MVLTKAQAKSLDILEVARSLGMEMKRKSHREYYWAEHDSFKIDTVKNTWHWYSQNLFGDTINLVQQMQNVSYKDAMVFLETGSFPEAKPVEEERKPFNYTLAPYEQPFVEARAYLKEIRGLSDDTIDFFLEKGVLAQAKRKDKEGVIEDVLVFKYLDRNQQLVGASLQGLVPDQERHPGKGYLKQIMYQSEAISGLNVSIGSPKRLIVTEAPIDLMSYYELHKDELNDVRLVAMEGLKEGVLSHYVLEILQERGDIPMDERDYTKSSELARTSRFLSVAAETSTLFQDHKYDDLITLAVDRDKAGTDFITKLREKKIPVIDARPPQREGQEKTDWNEILKQEKQLEKDEEIQLSSSFPDTSHLSPEDATWLKENWNNISFSVQSTSPSESSPAVEEKHPLDNQESIANTEENAVRLMSYEEVRQENEALTKELNNRIQSGELSIEFAPDFYLYDVFAKLGNSHPTKYLNDKRMEVLSPIHSLLSSIDDRTVDLYKKKGTPEQDSLYQALKPHQRVLGVDISTRFIGELAIAAYNTNKQIESLSSDSFGVYFDERTLDNLSQSIERMLEYPLIESGKRDFTYGFVTTPNTLYHYLEEQEGEVVLNRELLDNLISRLETHPIKIMEASEEKEKAPEKTQELDMIFEQQKNERTSGSLGSLQPEAEGSPTPVPKAGTFERSVTSRPTTSSHLLYFTINEEFQSSNDGYYHSISLDELTKLNRPIRRLALQNAAQYYLDELASSKIYYVTPDKTVQVHFEEKHFMHLTGIKPIALGQTPEKTLHDFAEGNGHFDNILLANNDAAFDKLKVLSDLSVATESTSFYFDDLTDLRRYDGRFDSLIKSDDKDIILLFKELEEENYIPISVFKSRTKLTKELETVDKTPILGVFRERDGQIEQLSINEEYVKDGGEEMLSILKNKQYEEVPKEIEQTTLENTLNSPLLDSTTFTQVLDTVYNLGVPGDISKTPEEFHQAWNQYLEYAKQHNDKFDQIVAAAGADHLLDTNSDFYKEWQQDHIYKENYHVRLQWAEERPDGPKLPFKETELISYQDFARELYKANQSFYSLHQEGLKQVTDGHPEGYISPTKVQFSIYAPDGELIQDSIRYNIGEEINPIAHKERLGTREMREHPELMKIDEAIFTQYHLERLASELDISQFSYALEDTPYADQLLSQVPFGVLENSPIGFSDSSHDSRLGFISFDGMDSVEVENLSAWFEKLGVKDSPMEQVALVEKWQKEIKDLSEKVEQTIENIRDEFEKTQEEEIKLEEQVHNKQELKRDADADGVSDDEELLQGTNPYDFRSKPGSKPDVEEGLQAEEVVLAAGSLSVADLTQNTDIGLYIRFNWSENKAIRDRFEEDELVPYEEFIEILYFENERLRPEGNGYYKTSFDIENEKGESYTFGIRYDIGSELYPLSEMMDERFSEEYIEYASKLDKKTLEKVQSKLDETKNNRKEIIDADEELKAEEVVLATSSLAVADFIQNKDMAGLSRHLKEGIKEFLDSDKYKDYLTKMSQLNNYSNRNLRLILAQNPEARQVASFKQWKENFGRHVKKGEKALRIFKPMTKIKKDENNQPILDKNGKPETVTFFGLVPVFDVSQTEGKEMPKAAEVKEQLTDLDYANLYRALMAIAKENDVSVRFEEMENNKHGYYSVPENQIVLRSNEMNKAQIIKTFLHEMAHAELHHADNPQKENLTRSTAELQAESVAYVVSSYYGIDTSEYSFNYLSGWSADKETLADLEAQLDIVQQEAKSLMVRMDQALEQLRLSQEKQTKRSFEQKLEKFKDQNKQAVEEHKQELKADAQSKKEKGFSK
ncbi:TPA: toprim domain-containing protein [Streptococcus pneumoniae]|nr:toprim domain-containing protein [Streptococcus pneumoniae]